MSYDLEVNTFENHWYCNCSKREVHMLDFDNMMKPVPETVPNVMEPILVTPMLVLVPTVSDPIPSTAEYKH